ncbi:MAG: hypothetical protein A2511_17455 [Deltaproteobacteria bacterium RIFOXYD12_FULL_50_9]|nr:MAG: hypothetical protein A2511_17455 [Deltaproteobacteria bacterium RIFOXYD12_FULL_50_9]
MVDGADGIKLHSGPADSRILSDNSSGGLGLCWWVHRLANLETLLGKPLTYLPFVNKPLAYVAGWGRKTSYFKALSESRTRNIPCLTIEDGFLRSVWLASQSPPFSVIVDDLGIYYDAAYPSRLEKMIGREFTEKQRNRAQMLIGAWRAARVSKYNHARDFGPYSASFLKEIVQGRYVLVVDQTLGDASIRYGMADAKSFQEMLKKALSENPEKMVLLKVHPEVMAGRKKGHFDLVALAKNPQVRVLGEDVHPVSLIEHAEAVYVVTSQMGFEGLLWGKPVRTFGMPFYAGWGLTEDQMPSPERRKSVPLENLVHAALVDYPCYIDPETTQRCEPERLIEWIGLQRRMRQRFPETIYALGFSIWKRSIVRSFFQGCKVCFVRRLEQIPDRATLVVWGRRDIG